MKYLFVGGPKHGEFLTVDDAKCTILIPVREPNDYARFIDHGPAMCLRSCCCSPTYRTVEYRRMDIGTDHIVYVARRTSW
jgi:hypothetical protein